MVNLVIGARMSDGDEALSDALITGGEIIIIGGFALSTGIVVPWYQLKVQNTP